MTDFHSSTSAVAYANLPAKMCEPSESYAKPSSAQAYAARYLHKQHSMKNLILNTLECPIGHFPCLNRSVCVAQEFVCNRHNDCLTGEDEQSCVSNHAISVFSSLYHRNTSLKNITCYKIVKFPKNCEFNCSTINCRNAGLFEIPTDIQGRLITMKLSKNDIKVIKRGDFTRYNQLRFLRMSNNNIEKIESEAFAELEHLELLNARHNRLTALVNGTFDGLSSLIELNLDGNRLKDIDFSVFAELTNLTDLSLRDNLIEQLTPETFANLKSLKILNLDGNKIRRIKPEDFKHLGQLEHLEMANNHLNHLDNTVFDGLTNILQLDISYNPVTNFNSRHIKHLKYIRSL
ncbi:hypothetical protein CHUAL_008481 [Chamberlinius hualienensis]